MLCRLGPHLHSAVGAPSKCAGGEARAPAAPQRDEIKSGSSKAKPQHRSGEIGPAPSLNASLLGYQDCKIQGNWPEREGLCVLAPARWQGATRWVRSPTV